jgi:DNA modification methylase
MAVRDQEITDRYAIYNGDSCEVLADVPDRKVGLSVFSPPFADLYCYSDSDADLGNCRSYGEFFDHFGFIISHLSRVMMPGRIVAVHCMDIPAMQERDGYIGVKDFPGDIIRAFQKAGFVYHSRHVIWKDPLIEATRTKALGLMHKQLCKDSTRSRAGLPDYLLGFRAPGENEVPVTHPDGLHKYCGKDDPGGEGIKRSHNIWRAYASPVWMDIRQTRTLDAKPGRDPEDEKHVCPLQLDTIERACVLWSNPGEVVLTPFMGVGSECYAAVLNGRRAIGIELKPSYYRQAVRNLASIGRDAETPDMFREPAGTEAEPAPEPEE